MPASYTLHICVLCKSDVVRRCRCLPMQAGEREVDVLGAASAPRADFAQHVRHRPSLPSADLDAPEACLGSLHSPCGSPILVYARRGLRRCGLLTALSGNIHGQCHIPMSVGIRALCWTLLSDQKELTALLSSPHTSFAVETHPVTETATKIRDNARLPRPVILWSMA